MRRQVLLTRLLLLEARSILIIGNLLRLVFRVRLVTQARRVRLERLVPPVRRVRQGRKVRLAQMGLPALRVLLVPSSQLGKASGTRGPPTRLVTLLFIPTRSPVLV